ncbi:ribbon-helix-helix protein [Komagataeibacter diospyri]|uniref:Plasmid segregation centromere-binding protein ParG n=1 Tax=Komagataeibacter diospyri TaxID=1932662 RepID=A0A4P5NY37_9PROT|nr:hypothetical protein [Komagataeibacter diospyri]GCE85304.1 hypothetical protein MSKU9_3445 [Komagataeibacter diospyri]
MTERRTLPGFAARPADSERWVRTPEKLATPNRFTARLTIDVTPALRGRLKVAAFQRGITVADMLRALLGREFPDIPGDVP